MTAATSPLYATLLRLALIQGQRDLNDSEHDQLVDALITLLERPTEESELIIADLVDELMGQDADAADAFLAALEVESTLVDLGARQNQRAMLIGIPLSFISGARPRDLALSTDTMVEMSELLTDTHVISPHAQVGLLPRLFRPEELGAQPYGALRNVTRMLGDQLLRGDPVRLEPGVFVEGPHQRSEQYAWGDNPYMELRYLVGVVLVAADELNTVFPPLADPDQPGEEGEDGDADGMWDEPFMELVDNAFLPMFDVQAVSPPDDLFTALYDGCQLWRETGIMQQLRASFEEQECVIVRATTFFEEETGRRGWDLSFVDDAGRERDHAPWELLHDEDEQMSMERFSEFCIRLGLTAGALPPLEPDH